MTCKPYKETGTTTERLDKIGIDAICDQIAEALHYREIAEGAGVSRPALMRWLLEERHAKMYALAREARADKLAEDILEIADDGSNDTYIDENGKQRTDTDVVARSKLRVDARKWLASKMLPKKYGEKIAVGGADDLPAVQITKIERVIVKPKG